jgi:hypothetical protein
MEGRHPKARFTDAAHRAAAWKARNNYGRHTPEQGPAVRTNARPARAPRSGLQLSYRKVLATLTDELARLGARDPEGRAQHVLRPALSEKQQQRLAEMNARADA